MYRLLRLAKDFSMPLAIIGGALGWHIFWPLKPTLPYLIGGMLFFTIQKINFREIRISRTHLIIFALQLLFALTAFYLALLIPWQNKTFTREVAQGLMICFLAPSATASAVIIGILGGDIAKGATFSLLSNLMAALVCPLLFTFTGEPTSSGSFLDTALHIFCGVAPIIFIPLLLSLSLKHFAPKLGEAFSRIPQAAFWLWVVSLLIVIACTVKFVTDRHCTSSELLTLSICGLAACVLQFSLGHRLGKRLEGDRIGAGQSFGQKNTTLAIWMAQTYLSPLCAIAPASYIIWQNTYNSFQIWHKGVLERSKNKPEIK